MRQPVLAVVSVLGKDQKGVVAQFATYMAERGVNIEDIHIDHDPGRPVGQVELVVDVDRAEVLAGALEERGWALHQ